MDFTPWFTCTDGMTKSMNGFTIIELGAVIAIIAILATITIVAFTGVQGRARDSDRRGDVANLTKALELYYNDNGAYPGTSGTWYVSNNANWGSTGLGGSLTGIIDSMPVDPKNTGNPTNAGLYGYSYYTATNCGRTAGQWYLLVYRFEGSTKERFTDGTCSTPELGDTYYTAGASYYRSVK